MNCARAGSSRVVCYLFAQKRYTASQPTRKLLRQLSASWVFATRNNKGQSTGEWCQRCQGTVWIGQVSQAFRHFLQGAGYAG